jgi:hypothetical protein
MPLPLSGGAEALVGEKKNRIEIDGKRKPVAVIAFGGNALLRPQDHSTQPSCSASLLLGAVDPALALDLGRKHHIETSSGAVCVLFHGDSRRRCRDPR